MTTMSECRYRWLRFLDLNLPPASHRNPGDARRKGRGPQTGRFCDTRTGRITEKGEFDTIEKLQQPRVVGSAAAFLAQRAYRKTTCGE
jgi:hypothetical protein